jgi:hypothetical protein
MVGKAGGDLHDMAAADALHRGRGELRHVEETGEIDRDDRREIRFAVLSERLGDEDARIVDERVDAPEPLDPSATARSAVRRSPTSPATARTSSSRDGAIVRATATTR